MKKFSFLLLFIVISVFIGLHLAKDPGYLLLAYGHWTVEMPLWLGIVFDLLIVLLLFYIYDFLHCCRGIPERFRFWSHKRLLKNAHDLTNRGLIALSEGYWNEAEKYLTRAAKDTDTPLINYLASAQAAQAQGADERRDDYLKSAHELNPKAAVAIGLTQAQLQLSHGQYEQTLATLKHLQELVPHHKFVLKLLAKVYKILGDWTELYQLLPSLKRYHVLNENELQNLEIEIYVQQLRNIREHSLDYIQKYWRRIPRKLRTAPELLQIYTELLCSHEAFREAESNLRHAISHEFSDALITIYGSFVYDEGKKQLNFAEGLLKTHKDSAALFFCLGKLCISQKLWGKAKAYLEACIHLSSQKSYLIELAKLRERLGETDDALKLYRQAAEASHAT